MLSLFSFFLPLIKGKTSAQNAADTISDVTAIAGVALKAMKYQTVQAMAVAGMDVPENAVSLLSRMNIPQIRSASTAAPTGG